MTELLNKLQLDNKKIILIFLLFIIVVYVDYSFLLKMQWDNIKNVKPEAAKLKTDIDILNKNLSASKDLNKGQGRQNNLPMRMISKGQLPLLLEEISNMAKSNNVTLMQIKQVKEVKQGKEVKQKEKENNPSVPNNLLALNIGLDLSGSYHDFGRFINDLENTDKFIAVEDMSIRPQAVDSLLQNASIVLKTYVKK